MNHNLLSQFLNVDDLSDSTTVHISSNSWHIKSEPSSSSCEDLTYSSTMDYDQTTTPPHHQAMMMMNCIPGGLSQISLPGSSRSPSPDDMTSHLPGGFNFNGGRQQQRGPSAIPAHLRNNINPSSLVSPPVLSTSTSSKKTSSPPQNLPDHILSPNPNPNPNPYSISAANTTALFTRASSVSSTTSSSNNNGGQQMKKPTRAPPSQAISTKDFIPPDVSGLSKREARLVKNRAAAFLSRQRKREEFEGLEARVEVLENDNARLYKELEAYRSGDSAAPTSPLSPTTANPAALQAELVGLRRQLAARDQELAKLHGRMQGLNSEANAAREMVARKDMELQEALMRSKQEEVVVDSDDSDSEEGDEMMLGGGGKKDLKSAGSMAFMVLLFSLSSLLTSSSTTATNTNTETTPPKPSRRPGMHHRDSSRDVLFFPNGGLSYDSFLSTSTMLSPSFGFDEDSLLSTPTPTKAASTNEEEVLQKIAAQAISGVKTVSPDEFEFDFAIPSPSPSSSSSSSSGFTFPKSTTDAKKKKIRVVVRSALTKTKPTTMMKVEDPSDIFTATGYGLDDFAARWAAAGTSSMLSPTMSSTSSDASNSRKRKRVVVEINNNNHDSRQRRRLSDDQEEERWDLSFEEEEDVVGVFGSAFDDDVQMRL